MPDWIAVIILGIIEGITEFIPISSTGHLLITEKGLIAIQWLSKSPGDLFNVVIQCGAVVAVLPLFSVRCQQLVFRWRERETRSYLLKLICAFGLTGAVGFVLEKRGFKLPDRPAPVAWALLVGGVLFLAVERWLRDKPLREEVTWPVAVAVGIGQLIAMIFPGASRSGSTILCSLALGLQRPAATEFSFLVGIPTMLAAGGLKIFKALHHSGPSAAASAPPENWGLVILGTLVAAVVSFAAVKWFLRYIQTHTFEGFGWYRIALGMVILVLVR